MVKKQIYTFGNTTVRNTTRFPKGLRVLANSKFNGNINTREDELGFAKELDANDVTKMEKKDDYSSGRKWRSAFDKLGFITPASVRRNKLQNGEPDPLIMAVKKKYPKISLSGRASEVTPQGQRMAQAQNVYEMQDTVLRALLAVQIESFDKDGQSFKPFVFTLQVMKALNDRGAKKGLNRSELLIVFSTSDHSKAGYIADQIFEYRKERAQEKGKRAKGKYDRNFLSRFSRAVNVKYDTAKTYGDPNFKYMLSSGLFSRQGSRLIFNQDKLPIIEQILQAEPHFITNKVDYYYQLWNGYPLPTDNRDVLISEVQRLAKKTGVTITQAQLGSVPDLKQLRIRLEEKQSNYEEGIFAANQCMSENVDNIISYFRVINGEIKKGSEFDNARDDMPTFLEWTTWRAFLAIDGLKNKPEEARGFQVDQDFFPVGNAPGGRPDITLEFKNYVLVVEVTLTSTSRQEAAEAEPVRRHVAQIQDQYPDKPVYGLFLAQTIDNNTAEMFRTGLWYNQDNPRFVNIVPMTITQFIHIMQEFQKYHFTNDELERLIEKCLIPRNATVPLWKDEINNLVQKYELVKQ